MVQYKNRYGDVFTFTRTEDGNILWQGNFEYIRYSYLNDLVGNQLTMIDPSGGPYLTIGSNMGLFDESFKGLFIKGFSKTPEGYLIITKQ